MSVATLVVLLLVLMLIGALPVYPYSQSWGYYPSGFLTGAMAVMALVLVL